MSEFRHKWQLTDAFPFQDLLKVVEGLMVVYVGDNKVEEIE